MTNANKKATAKSLIGMAMAHGQLGNRAMTTAPSNTTIGGNTPQMSQLPLPQMVGAMPMIPNAGGPANATTPIITGIQNTTNPYGVIPRVYGNPIRMYPPLAAQFVTLKSGNSQFAYGLFCLGYGELVISDLRLGDTPIGNFAGLTYQILSGTTTDAAITVYNQDLITTAVNQALAAQNTVQVTSGQGVGYNVDLSCPNGLYSQDANGNKTATSVALDIFWSDAYHATTASNSMVPGYYYTVAATNSPAAGSNVVINLPDTTVDGVTDMAVGTTIYLMGSGIVESSTVSAVVHNTSITVTGLANSFITPLVGQKGTGVLIRVSDTTKDGVTDTAVGAQITIIGGGRSEVATVSSVVHNVSITVASIVNSYGGPTIRQGNGPIARTVTATNNPAAGSNVVINISDTTVDGTTQLQIGAIVVVSGGGKTEWCRVNNIVSNTSITVDTLVNSYTAPSVQSNVWNKVVQSGNTGSVPTITITDNSSTIVKRTVNWTISAALNQRNIAVVRRTADSTSANLVNATQWVDIVAFGNKPMVNPVKDQNGNKIGISYIALSANSSDAVKGQIGQFNCLVASKLATWNGSSWAAPTATDNPAWVCADILTGTANRRPMKLTQLDGNTFKSWADFCTTSGRSFDFIYDTPTTVLQAARDVAAIGRGFIVFKDGLYTVAVDNTQSTIVQHFTPRNTDSFSGHITFPDLPHAYRVQFNNSAAKYQQDEIVVYADGYNLDGSNGLIAATKIEVLKLVGVVNANQAWREARHRYAVASQRRNTYSFNCDFENLACNRGDLVRLTHDVVLYGLYYGRIKSVQTDGSGNVTGITLDESPTMTAANSYSVRIRLSDGTSSLQTVNTTNAGSPSPVLTFTTPIPAATNPLPAADNLCMFGIFGKESVQCIVHEIQYQGDYGAHVTLLDYAPGVFQAELGTIPAFVSQITSRPVSQTVVPIPVITSVVSDQSVLVRNSDGSFTTRVAFYMQTPTSDIVSYETQFKPSDGTVWGSSIFTPVSQSVIYVTGVAGGSKYDFRIRQQNNVGINSDWNTSVSGYTVIGETTPPPDVPVFKLMGAAGTSIVGWVYDSSVGVTVPVDFWGFRLKYNLGANLSWTTGTVAANLITGNQFNLAQIPATGALTILLKAVNAAGVESTNTAVILYDFGSVITSNPLVSQNEAPNFSGALSGGSVISGVATATSTGALFWGSLTANFWSNNLNNLFWFGSYLQMTYQWTYAVDPQYIQPSGVAAPLLKLDLSVTADAWSIQYQTGSQSLFWNVGQGGTSVPFWGNPFVSTANFWGANQPFSGWPGQITAGADAYTFLITTNASNNTQSTITKAKTILDVPPVTETLNGIAISASGTRLPIVKTYRAIINIQLTAETAGGLTQPGQVVYTDKSTAGPMVFVYDKNGTAIAGIVDAYIQGY